MTAYSQSWKICVYVLRSLAFAPGGLQLIVYVNSGDQPPSTDINSGKRDTTTMCECSLTVNISLAVGCPPCQHSHFKKVWAQTDLDDAGLHATVHQGLFLHEDFGEVSLVEKFYWSWLIVAMPLSLELTCWNPRCKPDLRSEFKLITNKAIPEPKTHRTQVNITPLHHTKMFWDFLIFMVI